MRRRDCNPSLNIGNFTVVIKAMSDLLSQTYILQILNDLYDRHAHLLESLDLIWFDPEVFSQAIHAKGEPLFQCWGFIDGTCRAIARPIRNQHSSHAGTFDGKSN